ncbi:MAG TPA: hypothetical protein VJ740_06165 [Hyphomicrobiaceae bacterium]|nr:hypothetical protein [Hyphomicrobiaceae bacterium]
MARHALGVLGVVAAGILLAVSAAMNYRFGFSLGKTALDGQIYGAASAAADCFKALVPFFFFAALRNRMWSQALAAALVWTVVTGYSMTSALGHAALNRLDTTGQRAVEAANYKDLRADAKRAQDQLTWIPAHRPAETVSAELNVLKAQRQWLLTKECAEVTGRAGREFCQQYHKLNAEHASAQQSEKLEARIAEIGSKLAKSAGGTVMAEADPQASVLAKLTGLDVEHVQTALTLFVALLIEIGSGFGMYVAFAYWRINDRREEPAQVASAQPVTAAIRETERLPAAQFVPVSEIEVAPLAPVASEATPEAVTGPPVPRRLGANDNRVAHGVPDSDVQRFYRERVVAAAESASLTSTELYEEYCRWCEDNEKEPFAHPRVTREIGELGVKKERIGKRTRYFGIALRTDTGRQEDKKLPASLPRAA